MNSAEEREHAKLYQSNSNFFNPNKFIPKNNVSFENIREKNMNYMIKIRQNDRKDIIRNSRFKNVLRVTGQTRDNQSSLTQRNSVTGPASAGEFPFGLSHLAKVKDSQRILKMIEDAKVGTPDITHLHKFLSLMRDGERMQKHQAIICIRKLLSNKDALPIQEIIDLNGIPALIDLAKSTSELHLRLEATWCLANLASGNTQQTEALVTKDVIGVFEDILDDEYPQIVEQAVWGLGNIIGDSVDMRQMVVHSKVLRKLILLLNRCSALNIQKNIIWCLSNSLRIRPPDEPFTKMKSAVRALILAFNSFDNPVIKSDCIMGISDYCKSTLLSFFTEEPFLPNLRSFYQHLYLTHAEFTSIKDEISAIHKIIGNITNGDDFDTSRIVDQGFLKDLCLMLRVPDEMCKREICWILSNVAAGTPVQIASVLNEPNLFDNLVNLIYNSKKEIQREALWTVCNMTKNAQADQLRYLIQYNILGLFKEFLKLDTDPKMIILVLEAIPNMLKKSMIVDEGGSKTSPLIDVIYETGMAEQISSLQRHESEHIYEKCVYILENFFELEEY